MANQVEQKLTENLIPILQKERYATIATVDFETNGPNVNAISWVYTLNGVPSGKCGFTTLSPFSRRFPRF